MTDSSDGDRRVRVAIVRFTSLGDVIHALPVAAAIRAQRPGARISWLVEEREQVLLRDNPAIDDVIVVPLRRWRTQLTTAEGWRRSWTELREIKRTLRDAAFDVTLDFQGWAHKTSPFVLLTRAPLRIGFNRGHSRDPISPLATNRHVTPPPSATHIVDQNLALLAPMGITAPGSAQFPLPTFSDGETRAAEWRRRRGLDDGSKLVAVLPSTRGVAKQWPADRYRDICRRLLENPAVRLLILGGPGEEPVLNAVATGLAAERTFVYAPGPIPDLVAMLRHVHLAIGNDTGPLHVAAGHGVPSLGLFGPTRGARNGPYGAHCAFLQSATGRMQDLAVEEVWCAIRRLGSA
jgi:lipopolysaccharide heptosyltransferase I